MMEKQPLSYVTESILDGDPEGAVDAVRQALAAGLDPQVILNEGLMAGADEVGRQFTLGELFLPELMMAGKALKAAMEVLKPELQANDTGSAGASQGRVVIATVQTDIHDIGKSLVASMLSAAGFEVTDLGVDVPIKTIIDKAEEANADIIAVSALLTTSMPFIRDVIEMLKARGLRDQYRVIVGGAPVTPQWAEQVGADGTAPNAAEAVKLARRLLATV